MVHISLLEILKILITILYYLLLRMCIQKRIQSLFAILSFLFGNLSLSPVLMIFVLHKMMTLFLETILTPHLLYGDEAIMVTAISRHVIGLGIKQAFLHSIPPFRQRFTIELPILYIINFVLSRLSILKIINIQAIFFLRLRIAFLYGINAAASL